MPTWTNKGSQESLQMGPKCCESYWSSTARPQKASFWPEDRHGRGRGGGTILGNRLLWASMPKATGPANIKTDGAKQFKNPWSIEQTYKGHQPWQSKQSGYGISKKAAPTSVCQFDARSILISSVRVSYVIVVASFVHLSIVNALHLAVLFFDKAIFFCDRYCFGQSKARFHTQT